MQRYLMRVRADFQGCRVLTYCTDKSKAARPANCVLAVVIRSCSLGIGVPPPRQWRCQLGAGLSILVRGGGGQLGTSQASPPSWRPQSRQGPPWPIVCLRARAG